MSKLDDQLVEVLKSSPSPIFQHDDSYYRMFDTIVFSQMNGEIVVQFQYDGKQLQKASTHSAALKTGDSLFVKIKGATEVLINQ